MFGLLLGVAGLGMLEVPEPMLMDMMGAVFSGGSLSAMAAEAGAGAAATAPAVPTLSLDSLLPALGDSGEFWMLLAAQSMAVGTIMVR